MENQRNDREAEIDLKDCFNAILKRWWLVAVSMVLGIVVAFFACYIGYEPQYKAMVKMYVNNRTTTSSMTVSDINVSRALVSEYLVVLKSRPTLDKTCNSVNNMYGYNLSYESLSRMVSGASIDDTTVFYVTVTDTSAERAINIVNSIADNFPAEVEKIFEGASARVIEYAVDATPVGSGFATKIALGAFIGIFLACAYSVIMGVFINDTIESDEWIINTFENRIPLLGVIPDSLEENPGRYGGYKNYSTARTSGSGSSSSADAHGEGSR